MAHYYSIWYSTAQLTCCHQGCLKVHVLIVSIFADSDHSEHCPLRILLVNNLTRTDLGDLIRHLKYIIPHNKWRDGIHVYVCIILLKLLTGFWEFLEKKALPDRDWPTGSTSIQSRDTPAWEDCTVHDDHYHMNCFIQCHVCDPLKLL